MHVYRLLALFLFVILFGQVAIGSESSLYEFQWLDSDKKVYVLQNKKYKKENSFYVGMSLGMNTNQAFVDSYGAHIKGGYFFSENWGIEANYASYSGSESDDAKGVKEQGTVPYIREITEYISAYLVWSPFYGKLNTFNTIVYFDWMFGLGLADISSEDNRNQVGTSPGASTTTTENTMGLSWMTSFRFYLSKSYSLRVDLTALHFDADRIRRDGGGPVFTSSELFHNYDVSIGVNYTF